MLRIVDRFPNYLHMQTHNEAVGRGGTIKLTQVSHIRPISPTFSQFNAVSRETRYGNEITALFIESVENLHCRDNGRLSARSNLKCDAIYWSIIDLKCGRGDNGRFMFSALWELVVLFPLCIGNVFGLQSYRLACVYGWLDKIVDL